jgi:enoyl-CoA hydratase
MGDLAQLSVTGAVAVLTLSDPARRNVLSAPMVRAIGAAIDRAEADENVRCLVVTGAGRAFCAGAELDTLERSAAGEFDSVREVYDGFLRVLNSPLATVAAVNGPAVGAGFNLALACDVRLASDEAAFDTRFSALRLHPGGGHTWLLIRAVGYQQAVLACEYGQRWTAQDALRVGLVAEVCAPDELVGAAVALGARLEGQEAAYTRRLTSTLRYASSGIDHAAVLEAETQAQQWSVTRPAFVANVQALRAQIAMSSKSSKSSKTR